MDKRVESSRRAYPAPVRPRRPTPRDPAVTNANAPPVADESAHRPRAGPRITWPPGYPRGWLRGDVVAGLTLAAYLLPAGIGDASLANLPPEAGLYACLFSGVGVWLFCSSKQTVITVTSALSLLIGASIGELSAGDPSRHAALAACAALLMGVIAIAAWLVRAGNAVGFFSETVLAGFKAGV